MRMSYLGPIFVLLLAGCFSCRRQPQPLVLTVLRDSDAPFAKSLAMTTYAFDQTQARLISGRHVVVGTTEIGGARFASEFEMVIRTHPELVILESGSEVPKGSGLKSNTGSSTSVCGGRAEMYIPTWVSGEKREAAEIYQRFIESNCP